MSLIYRNDGIHSFPLAYSDADYAGDVDTRRSTSSYVYVNRRPCDLGITKAKNSFVKYDRTRVCIGLHGDKRSSLVETATQRYRISVSEGPIVLNIDSQSGIRLIKNPQFHKRTKHIDIRYHFIREKYNNKEIDVKYISTDIQFADLFTKALHEDRCRMLREYIGMS